MATLPIKRRKPKKSPTLDKQQKVRTDLILPPSLAAMRSTPGKLASGKFQRAMMAFFATPAGAALFSGMIPEAESGNVAAARLLADIYQYTPQKPGMSISLTQNNANVAERRGRDSDGPVSFEQIARILEEEDQNRKALPPALDVQFEATPEDVEGRPESQEY